LICARPGKNAFWWSEPPGAASPICASETPGRTPPGRKQNMERSDTLIDHFMNPRNVGSLDEAADNVGTGIAGEAQCGDVMKLQIMVDGAGTIVEAKFKTFGCSAAIAASSLTTVWLKGRTIETAAQLKKAEIAAELSLPEDKMHCSALAAEAVAAAIADWRKKNAKEQRPKRRRKV
jgi:nitrogen fixation NifU-like protein